MRLAIVFIVAIFLAVPLRVSALEVSGAIYGPTNSWTTDNSPIYITGDTWVAPDSWLSISPGVEVVFTDHYALIDSGVIYAVGTDISLIEFTANESWDGLKFVNANGLSRLEYCVINYADVGISCKQSDIIIANCEISAFRIGIECFNSSPEITNNMHIRVENDGGGGGTFRAISLQENSKPNIHFNKKIECIVSANSTAIGIEIGDSSPEILNNSVEVSSYNSALGIKAEGSDTSKVTIERNLIVASGYGNVSCVEIDGCANLDFVNNTAVIKGTSESATGLDLINSYVLILNNIVVGNYLSTGIRVDFADNLHEDSGYNDLWGHDDRYVGILEPLSNDIAADPLFRDMEADDYRLTWKSLEKHLEHPDDPNYPVTQQDKSPCIDAGDPYMAPVDIEYETPVDIGWKEYLYNPSDTITIVSVRDDRFVPSTIGLVKTYPNPFNNSLNIDISVSHKSAVSIALFDISGRYVDVIAQNQHFDIGSHGIVWKAKSIPAGEYLLQYIIDGKRGAKTVLYLP